MLSMHSKLLHAGSTSIGNHTLPLTRKLNAESKSKSLTKKTIHTSRFTSLLLSLGISILLSGLFAPQIVQAADGTWTGTSGATWSTSAINWSGVSGTPWDITNGSGNTAIFSSGANATVSGGSNIYVNNITFNANTTLLFTSPPEAVVTLAGANATINAAAGTTSTIKTVLAGTNGLIKTGGGTVNLDPGDGWWSNTFSGPITINGGRLTSIRSTSLGDGAGAITINSGGTLNVDWSTVTRTGLVTVNGGTLQTGGGSPQLINNGAGFVLQNGGAINTSLGGSGGLTVNGARSYLYSANTYTGATVINAGGDLALMFGGALSTTTALNLSGVLLANNKSHTVGGLTGASTGLLYGDAAGTFTVNKVSGTDSYGGIIQNVGTFIKDGAGTLSLTHANNNTTFPGALTVNNGVLELGGAGRFNAGSYNGAISLSSASSVLQIATSANQTLSGAISGSGSLVKSSTGTNTLSGANSYAGGTTISGGTLVASHANALGDAAGAVTVSTNGVLRVNANMTRTGTVTVNGGELGSDNGSTLTNNGGGFVLTGSSAAAAVVLAGSGGLTVSSPDARLWTQATYSGATTVTSGQLNICGSGGISTNSAVSIASGATVNLTSFSAPTNINRTIAGLTGAGTLHSGGGGTVTVNKASGTDTFSGVISGGTGLIKEGASALALAGANSYTGSTEVNAGTLALANGSGLGSTAAGTTVASGAQLRLNAINAGFTVGNEALTISGEGIAGSAGGALRNAAGNNTYQGKITLAADATIGTAGSTTLTLDVASGNAIESANRNLTIDGAGTTLVNDAISLGAGGLTKIGSGTATLAAANNYSGATTVNDGLLKIVSGGSISSSTTVNNGGILDVGGIAGNVQVNSGGLLKGSGSVGAFTLASSGTLTPGNSPGTLTAASAIVLGGSTYNWEISALSGTAGTTWDLFSVTGLLNMSDVTSTNKWNLVVTGDSGFAGWTDTSSYSYVFAQAASVSGFSSTVGTDVTSLFNITTSGIASKPNASFNVNGDFKVVVGSANGFTTLNLMAVPEPSTGSMMGLGLAGLVVTRLLRRKIS
jgi:autotransporter-associated beta strand protein